MGSVAMRLGSLNSAAVIVLMICLLFASCASASAPDSLYAETAARALARNITDPNTSYLLYDLSTGSRIAAQWEHLSRPVPVGSLVKPFTALAYAEGHGYHYPEFSCTGAGSCWRPRGHGRNTISQATAFSCNSYFTQLAEETKSSSVNAVAQRFGLNGPGLAASHEALIGMNGVWREKPGNIALAYAELLRDRQQPGVREIVVGMALCARSGTGAELGTRLPHIQALAKTGTAPCTHAKHGPGDGFVVVIWPAESPRYLLLVREHAKPGSFAARTAAQMLHLLEPQP
ncbi:MAG TPA: penicillin-binding transpeptidase domain-containing protein [Terriglobales bacterium]